MVTTYGEQLTNILVYINKFKCTIYDRPKTLNVVRIGFAILFDSSGLREPERLMICFSN